MPKAGSCTAKSILSTLFRLFILCGVPLSGIACAQSAPVELRVNQVGYLTNAPKVAVAFSKKDLSASQFKIIDARSGKEVFSGSPGKTATPWGGFAFVHPLDFTRLEREGEYRLEMNGRQSFSFRVARNIYNSLPDSLLLFLRVQRCGPTNPLMHETCHLFDSPFIDGDNPPKGVDLTGGWHDAGDYIKFINTTALSAYMLLFTYDFNRQRFEFDRDKNGAPDILEEAKVGLDWLLRANYAKGALISQVQNLSDHDVGWRMPENDTLRYNRPAYKGLGKNTIGIFSAALALGARIWKERFYDSLFSNRCLAAARDLYRLKDSAPDVDQTNSGAYIDGGYLGKLALGAAELYEVTRYSGFLDDARNFASAAGPDYWWSFGDVNSLVHYRLAPFDAKYLGFLYTGLNQFRANSAANPFSEGASFTWGTTTTFLGIAAQALLYQRVSGSKEFDTLIAAQCNYVLGSNPWNISFIYNAGHRFTKNFHHQVAYFRGGRLPGAVAAGPAPVAILKNYNISRQPALLDAFNTTEVQYFDDRNDYITNEPTIFTNATAIFVFGNLK